jgi:hypothetical protein
MSCPTGHETDFNKINSSAPDADATRAAIESDVTDQLCGNGDSANASATKKLWASKMGSRVLAHAAWH